MTAPSWQDDNPNNLSLIQSNATQLISELHASAAERIMPTPRNCAVGMPGSTPAATCRSPAMSVISEATPLSGNSSITRSDSGRPLKDGNLEKMGVWASRVNEEMAAVLAGLHAVFAELDARLPVGKPPGTADEILQVISFAALAHGECLRVHPFANGNGRIARLLVAFICLRYAVPMFLHIKPRPEGEDYVRASRDSMGRPPDFVGNHTTTTAVFAHLLADELAGERVA